VLIRHLLRTFDLGGVNVGTIEDYQTVERDVIVLSLTRSNATFVRNSYEASPLACLIWFTCNQTSVQTLALALGSDYRWIMHTGCDMSRMVLTMVGA
jgi:hypothetical protein